MKTTPRLDTVRFTSNGRVVVPHWLRKEFAITKGTRAVVFRKADAIVLKPITLRYIRSLRGTKGSGVLKSLMAGRMRDRGSN